MRKLLIAGVCVGAAVLFGAMGKRAITLAQEKTPMEAVPAEERGPRMLLRKDRNCLATKEAAMAFADILALNDLSEAERTKAVKSLRLRQEAEGLRFYPTSNVVVFPLSKTAERGFIEVVAAQPQGLPQSRFWVLAQNLEAANGITKEGYTIMDGRNAIQFGNSPVSSLSDMVKAVYLGDISPQNASRYIFKRSGESLGEVRLSHLAGDFVIYEFSVSGRGAWKAALPRDTDSENSRRGNLSVEAYYKSLTSLGSGGGPLDAGTAVRIVGVEEFTTRGGLVKRILLLEPVP